MPQTTIYAAPRSLPPAVAVHELARLFAHHAALAGVSLTVEAGRLIALRGPNGAGKTTLLRILATSLLPSFGSAQVDGLDVTRDAAAVRARVAYLGHATGLYDDLTAAENLRFAASMLGHADPRNAIRAALERTDLLADADRRVRGFSAGMRRRLALGRLLLREPSLVLLDEPHAALDADGQALVDGLLEEWHGRGVTVLVASHQSERISRLADGWARLEAGLLAEIGGDGITSVAPAAALPSMDGMPAAARLES